MTKSYRSELVGLFGCPVDENPTGVMQEAAFAAAGVDFRYLTMKVEPADLHDAIKGLRAMNMRGVNLTIPHKIAVIPFLDELTEAAEIIGAVNTVVNEDGKLIGENTDGKGFITALENADCKLAGKNVTILGAGGAARAIAVECALSGAAKIVIINRNVGRGEELVELINEKTAADASFMPWIGTAKIPADTDILVNGTSIGLYPDVDQKPDVDYTGITEKMVLSDVIFNDPNSLFLHEGEIRGAKVVNGLGMLAYQGALGFKLWTGVEPPVEVMVGKLKEEFGL